MTARDIYEATLVEINKENAQSFTIEEFNYVLNKTMLAFVNEKYNFCETNQQMSDDLRVLLKTQTYSITDINPIASANTTATFNPTTSYYYTSTAPHSTLTLSTTRDLVTGSTIKIGSSSTPYAVTVVSATTITVIPSASGMTPGDRIYIQSPAVSLIDLPTAERVIDINFSSSDYLHLLSCRLTWKTKRPYQDEITSLVFPAKRLTFDLLNAIQNNTFLRPASNRPYFQVFTNDNSRGIVPYTGTEYKAYQNKPKVKLHVGPKALALELRSVDLDYIKIPETITLFDSDIFSVLSDTSQVLELPDYLKNEIVKRCTIYLLEKAGDPRIQTQPAFNQEIPSIPMNMQVANNTTQQKQQAQQNQQQ